MLMSRLLIFTLLGGVAAAQAVPSSFSSNGRVPAADPADTTTPAEISGLANPASRLPDLLPQPTGKPTLIGGIISKADGLRDEITIKVFGGKSTRILFDGRTHFYRDGAPASADDLRDGERVYIDTMLAGTSIFAKNIRVVTQGSAGQGSGQIVSYDNRTGALTMSDEISPQGLKLHVLPTTTISRGDRAVSSSELVPGTLVSIAFAPNPGREPVARQISILANPGNTFVFQGRVVQLDVHIGLLMVIDPRDQKTYEISFDPNRMNVSDNLREGANVQATTTFDGSHYVASSIQVDPTANR